MSEVVTFTLQENIGVITIDNPPINALGIAVRQGLVKYIDIANADDAVKAIVICANGRTFPAGADIAEFGKPPLAPHLSDVCTHVENSLKPVIAALFGTVLGGGLELALGAHFRLATTTAKFGFPEVLLGILPGAGGTQRTPRITGAQSALELMISGAPINATKALGLGLIDKIVTGTDVKARAIEFAQKIMAENTAINRTGHRVDGFADAGEYATQIAAMRAKLAKANGLFAPLGIVDCVEAAAKMPLEQGLEFERDKIMACMRTTEHAALVHVFFAERKSAKMPRLKNGGAAVKPKTIDVLGIVGGGTMGAGITVSALNAGLKVIMVERDDDSLKRGIQNVEKVYMRDIAKGRMDAAKMAAIMANYTPSTDYADLSSVDMVIEAVFEQMDVKKAVFKQLDRVLKKDAVLATNTSYLNIDELAATTSRPENIIGLHFFSPANIMRLLEIVVPAKASAEVVATGFALAKRMGKVAVRAGVCDGFIGNRILSVYAKSAVYMMEDGASPYEIDHAIREFGYPIGLYQMSDLAGGDIGWDTRKRLANNRNPAERYVHIDDKICENGWFGQKTGRGYYIYQDGARIGTQDPEILAIVDEQRHIAGITPKTFTEGEIIERYMAAMINEGANVLLEGIALRPSDIDVTFIYGYGFPRHKGGPMKYADTIGIDKIIATIERLSQDDPYFWQVSPLLKKLVAEGKNFDSLNSI